MPPPAPTEVVSTAAASDSSIYDKQLAWKLHGQRKLASKSQELRAQQDQECTFVPKVPSFGTATVVCCMMQDKERTDRCLVQTNSKLLRPFDDTGFEEEEGGEEKVTAAETEAALLHPTESQESSIQLHLARQGRAREHAREAQHK
ncbi:hypothetical protein BBO99_00001774 [Phytophthora kernoviae]|uniref:Uncharacterized protein n=2 Tax=Phytophthora kernoviae TaxID=325452 RepID=A0A3R7G3B4_9STRA|nr:hypothetical protein G195_008965 [Phytophthora kernoviae 00238/432]KAG2526136.1 hypothetical protein JM16_004068 [Phytophthora kernoviae]KAG2532060.1 hypothetical protein JM18_001458 [Phytophthora kernoviae]RLN27188.1 hypothetical protein BBI17_001545 [Phytophthora kernoviae]RLN83806.1 hypothetical protein BBO99_00001774 [Phytophthora kernoviae]